jgi:hypothetical protein
MLNLMVGCLSRSQENRDLKKVRLFPRGWSVFLSNGGVCKIKSSLYGASKRSLPAQSPNDHYQRRAQTITVNAESKFININAEPKYQRTGGGGGGRPERSEEWSLVDTICLTGYGTDYV